MSAKKKKLWRVPMPYCVSCLHKLAFGNKRVAKQFNVHSKVAWRWLRALGPCGWNRKQISGRLKWPERPNKWKMYYSPIGPKLPKLKLTKEEVAARERERYKTDPQYMLRGRMRRRIRKMIGDKKAHRSSQEIIGCNWATFKAHMESQFKRGMSWKNYGRWHIDHIIPCAEFDLTDDAQLKRCFHFSNLRPLWAADNISKGSKLIACQPELLITL